MVPKKVRKAHVKRHYFTKGKAKRWDKPDFKPREYDEASVSTMERSEIKAHFSELIENNILKRVTYRGNVVDRREFVEEEGEIASP